MTTIPAAKDRFISTAELMETYDWASTPLGRKETWPQSLKTVVSVVMTMKGEGCIWWEIKDGPQAGEWRLIYNDAVRVLSCN
jgi:hypothetical protein